ncbi:MAG: hypothetical protein JO250_10720 [Armatimonadetes bacterium]|nr:hypothetical protein [Armatimonadota bacterium]
MTSRLIYSEYNYAQLARALAKLGFSESRGKTDLNIPYRAYDNPEHEAWTMLPDLADDERVEHVYLRRVERVLEEHGIVDSETFHRLIQEAAQKEPHAA